MISLSDQLAFLYRGDALVAVSTISSGTEDRRTPTGIFNILEKKPMHRSRKYDNAPMPFMQRIDQYGIALHAGFNPGRPASHGCVRLPAKFAAKLYTVTKVGSTRLHRRLGALTIDLPCNRLYAIVDEVEQLVRRCSYGVAAAAATEKVRRSTS